MVINHNGHKIELYSQADKLPIRRYQEFNINLLIDSGIGSDMQSVQNHILSLNRLIDSDPATAKVELINLLQNINFVLSRMSPKYNAFAILCKTIDGRTIKDSDLTEDGIKNILEELDKMKFPFGKLQEVVHAVKKKLKRN